MSQADGMHDFGREAIEQLMSAMNRSARPMGPIVNIARFIFGSVVSIYIYIYIFIYIYIYCFLYLYLYIKYFKIKLALAERGMLPRAYGNTALNK